MIATESNIGTADRAAEDALQTAAHTIRGADGILMPASSITASRIRRFAETRWPYGVAEEQCDLTALLVLGILGRGSLRGGFSYEQGRERPSGGYLAPSGRWELHYWAEADFGSGPEVIDLTADQFGGPKVFISPSPHPQYVSTFSEEHLTRVQETSRPTVEEWLRQWLIFQEPQRLSSGSLQVVLTRDRNPFLVMPTQTPMPAIETILTRMRNQPEHRGSALTWHAVPALTAPVLALSGSPNSAKHET